MNAPSLSREDILKSLVISFPTAILKLDSKCKLSPNAATVISVLEYSLSFANSLFLKVLSLLQISAFLCSVAILKNWKRHSYS